MIIREILMRVETFTRVSHPGVAIAMLPDAGTAALISISVGVFVIDIRDDVGIDVLADVLIDVLTSVMTDLKFIASSPLSDLVPFC